MWQGSTDTVEVRFFPAPAGAILVPGECAFRSERVTSDMRDYKPDLIGSTEWGGIKGHRQNPIGFTGRKWCGSLDAARDGGVIGVTPLIVCDEDGFPISCDDRPQSRGLAIAVVSASWQGRVFATPALALVAYGMQLRVDQGGAQLLDLVAYGMQLHVQQSAFDVIELVAAGSQYRVTQAGTARLDLVDVSEQGRPIHDYTPEALLTHDGRALFVQPGTP